MPSTPATLKATDLARAYKVAQNAGLPVLRTYVETGRIILVHSDGGTKEAETPFDSWKANHAN
jgi:hypothetical protein